MRTKRAQRRKNPLLCINESDLRLIAKLVRFSLTEAINLFENQSEEKADISDIIKIINNPNHDGGEILKFIEDRMLSSGESGNKKTNFSTARSIAELDENQFDKFTSAIRDAFENKFKEFSQQKGRTQEKKVDNLKSLYTSTKTALEIIDSIKYSTKRASPSEDIGINTKPGRKSKKAQDVTNTVKKLKMLNEPDLKAKISAIFNKIQQLTHPKVKYHKEDIEEKIKLFIDNIDPESGPEEITNNIDKINKTIDVILKQQKDFEKTDPVTRSKKEHDPFSSNEESTGFMSSLKKLFGKIRSENFDLGCDVITEEIIKLMIADGHLKNSKSTVRAHRIIREMLEDYNKMGPAKTGVFNAPHEEHPGYMLLGNLKRLAAKANDLADLASPWDDAEPWIESKINSAAEHVDAVHDYIMYSVLGQEFNAAEHEDMMYECGEMSGDLMMEPMYSMDASGSDLIGGRNFGDGGSAQMARGQLFQIAKKSQSLSDRLTDDDTLPEWLQSKVAMAYQTISAISDYLDYKMVRQDSGDPVLETRNKRRSR